MFRTTSTESSTSGQAWRRGAGHSDSSRAFELIEQYADHPMDLADASLVVAAEGLATTKIFTIDRQDFLSYRVRRGHRLVKLEIVD